MHKPEPAPIGPVDWPDGPATLEGTPPDHRPDDYSYDSPSTADVVVLRKSAATFGGWAPIVGASVDSVRHSFDGEANKARLLISLDTEHLNAAGSLGTRHFTHVLEELGPNTLIRVVDLGHGDRADWPLFEGYPIVNSIIWNRNLQTMTVECVDFANDRLRYDPSSQIFGSPMRANRLTEHNPADSDIRIVQAEPLVFNKDGRPNCSRDWFERTPCETPYGTSYTPMGPVVTDPDDETAVYFTPARALALLLCHWGPAKIDCNDLLADIFGLRGVTDVTGGADRFVQAMTARLPEVSANACNLMEAILLVCEREGLHFDLRLSAIPEEEGSDETVWVHWLNIVPDKAGNYGARRMRMPALLEIPRDPPFTIVGSRTAPDVAADNAVTVASINFDHRPINTPFLLGDDKRYEVTANLLPGWRPFPVDNEPAATRYRHYANADPSLGPLLTGRLLEIPTLAVLDAVTDVEAAQAYWAALIEEIVVPGGDDFETTPCAQFHPEHSLHRYLSEVGRLWILGESYRFTAKDRRHDGTVWGEHSLWHRSAYAGFGWYGPFPWDAPFPLHYIGVPVSDCETSRSRPLGPPLWVDENGVPATVIVDVSFDGGLTWSPLKGGQFRVLPDVAGILLTEANLGRICPPDTDWRDDNLIYAYIEGRFELAVTATLEGDRRINCTTQTFGTVSREMAQTFDDRAAYKYVARAGSSKFYSYSVRDRYPWLTPDVLLAGEPRDDTPALALRATRLAEGLSRSVVSANPQKFYLEYDARPGDFVDRSAGLGLTWEPAPIKTVEYLFDPKGGRRTRWLIGDEREEGRA